MDGKLRAGKIAARESRNLDQKFFMWILLPVLWPRSFSCEDLIQFPVFGECIVHFCFFSFLMLAMYIFQYIFAIYIQMVLFTRLYVDMVLLYIHIFFVLLYTYTFCYIYIQILRGILFTRFYTLIWCWCWLILKNSSFSVPVYWYCSTDDDV